MRLGIGGGAFGVRGGISTRGVGVGVGPFSAGTSWRRGGGGGGGFLAWLIGAAIVLLVVAWPYLLGTYVAVRCGAGNPSVMRFVVGWFFEVLYVAGLIGWFITARESSARRATEETQRITELTASGAVYEAQHGRSVAFRHGTCTVNHRSRDAASKCRKSDPVAVQSVDAAPSIANTVAAESQTVDKAALVWAAGVAVIGLVVGLVIALVGNFDPPPAPYVSATCPMQNAIAGTSTPITLPELAGLNAGIAEMRLKGLGLANVELSSANPKYSMVLAASNWTVVNMDPRPGCVVNRDQKVVVNVTKP